jgi:hypothetical protein
MNNVKEIHILNRSYLFYIVHFITILEKTRLKYESLLHCSFHNNSGEDPFKCESLLHCSFQNNSGEDREMNNVKEIHILNGSSPELL